ncbi:Huntington interacting protein related 1-like [Homarus americanus]|uniref:Huntington interacting protein related 1-like n=1 Tax=Homarus americanus TaxID=6706 RepID=A0A8J5TKL2_HOMAM|nr:Huntington interacting protein related 1-like [Homarus americanus]
MLKCCSLVSLCEDQSPGVEDMVSVVQREMDNMDSAIRDAVEKFTAMLENSRATDSGTQLEVNESILGTCSELMAAVRLLVQRGAELQKEIVDAGKGGSSPREFYKRNHRWTEGLLSGAKTVAIACQALMTAADQVVSGKGKFEEVIVASREIAASSMQLVMASRVKADKSSLKLTNLKAAAKTISTLTGTVVATAENCRDKVVMAGSELSTPYPYHTSFWVTYKKYIAYNADSIQLLKFTLLLTTSFLTYASFNNLTHYEHFLINQSLTFLKTHSSLSQYFILNQVH